MVRMNNRTRLKSLGGKGDTAKWANRLKGIPCFIIGNGPLSLSKDSDLSILDDYFTIGINRAFKIIDPTILIWQDLALYVKHKNLLKKKLKAIKYCRVGAEIGNRFYHFRMSGRESKLASSPDHLYGLGSSGPLSFQLAYALGCNPIILVGMDCRYSSDGKTDFYGKNPMHRPHTLKSCKSGLKWIRNVGHRRKIINCSKNKVFKERVKLKEAIVSLNDVKIRGRDALVKKLLTGK